MIDTSEQTIRASAVYALENKPMTGKEEAGLLTFLNRRCEHCQEMQREIDKMPSWKNGILWHLDRLREINHCRCQSIKRPNKA